MLPLVCDSRLLRFAFFLSNPEDLHETFTTLTVQTLFKMQALLILLTAV